MGVGATLEAPPGTTAWRAFEKPASDVGVGDVIEVEPRTWSQVTEVAELPLGVNWIVLRLLTRFKGIARFPHESVVCLVAY